MTSPMALWAEGGKVDQYPIWNRVFIHGWLPESTITDDPTLVADTYGATDPNAKYLLRLGPQNDFDCISYKLVTVGGIAGADNTILGNVIDTKNCITATGSNTKHLTQKVDLLGVQWALHMSHSMT